MYNNEKQKLIDGILRNPYPLHTSTQQSTIYAPINSPVVFNGREFTTTWDAENPIMVYGASTHGVSECMCGFMGEFYSVPFSTGLTNLHEAVGDSMWPLVAFGVIGYMGGAAVAGGNLAVNSLLSSGLGGHKLPIVAPRNKGAELRANIVSAIGDNIDAIPDWATDFVDDYVLTGLPNNGTPIGTNTGWQPWQISNWDLYGNTIDTEMCRGYWSSLWEDCLFSDAIIEADASFSFYGTLDLYSERNVGPPGKMGLISYDWNGRSSLIGYPGEAVTQLGDSGQPVFGLVTDETEFALVNIGTEELVTSSIEKYTDWTNGIPSILLDIILNNITTGETPAPVWLGYQASNALELPDIFFSDNNCNSGLGNGVSNEGGFCAGKTISTGTCSNLNGGEWPAPGACGYVWGVCGFPIPGYCCSCHCPDGTEENHSDICDWDPGVNICIDPQPDGSCNWLWTNTQCGMGACTGDCYSGTGNCNEDCAAWCIYNDHMETADDSQYTSNCGMNIFGSFGYCSDVVGNELECSSEGHGYAYGGTWGNTHCTGCTYIYPADYYGWYGGGDGFECRTVGCTKEIASNYNPDANIEDGSCIDLDVENLNEASFREFKTFNLTLKNNTNDNTDITLRQIRTDFRFGITETLAGLTTHGNGYQKFKNYLNPDGDNYFNMVTPENFSKLDQVCKPLLSTNSSCNNQIEYTFNQPEDVSSACYFNWEWAADNLSAESDWNVSPPETLDSYDGEFFTQMVDYYGLPGMCAIVDAELCDMLPFCRRQCILGDLNNDGGWNVLDIVTLANCVLAGNCAELEYGTCGDLNGDGGYNVLDVVTLANCVLAGDCGGRVNGNPDLDTEEAYKLPPGMTPQQHEEILLDIVNGPQDIHRINDILNPIRKRFSKHLNIKPINRNATNVSRNESALYCCYDNLQNPHMQYVKDEYNTYLRYHAMFWELGNQIPDVIKNAEDDREVFGFIIKHMFESIRATQELADEWNLDNEYLPGHATTHGSFKTRFTQEVIEGLLPFEDLPFITEGGGGELYTVLHSFVYTPKAFLTTLIELGAHFAEHFGRGINDEWPMKFQLNEFNILNGMIIDLEYSPGSNFISYVNLLEALKPTGSNYHGENYSLRNWDLYKLLIIGVQGHIINNHHFRGLKFYNSLLPGEYRATVIYDKFGSYIWKQLEKLRIASDSLLDIAVTEFDVYTEGFCNNTYCENGEQDECYNIIDHEVGDIYIGLYQQDLLTDPWITFCEADPTNIGGRNYGTTEEYIAAKFYEAFYYQVMAHPNVMEISHWPSVVGPNDRHMTNHYLISGEPQFADFIQKFNFTTPQDSCGIFKTDDYNVKPRIAYEHSDNVDRMYSEDVQLNFTGVSEIQVDNLKFGIYEIIYSNGERKYFNIPTKAGKSGNPESFQSGEYCSDLSKDLKTCYEKKTSVGRTTFSIDI